MPLSGSTERRVICAPLAKWWNTRQRSAISGSSSGESGGRGSFSKTSSAAPAMIFFFKAFASAFLFTTGPGQLFPKYAVGFLNFSVLLRLGERRGGEGCRLGWLVS